MRHTVFNWRTKKEVARRVVTRPDGLYTRSDMTFVLGCDGQQCRYVIKSGTKLGKKFSRARAAKDAVMNASGCAKRAQVAYIEAMRADGLKPTIADKALLLWRKLTAPKNEQKIR